MLVALSPSLNCEAIEAASWSGAVRCFRRRIAPISTVKKTNARIANYLLQFVCCCHKSGYRKPCIRLESVVAIATNQQPTFLWRPNLPVGNADRNCQMSAMSPFIPFPMECNLPNLRFCSARTAPFCRRQTYGLTGRARWHFRGSEVRTADIWQLIPPKCQAEPAIGLAQVQRPHPPNQKRASACTGPFQISCQPEGPQLQT
ncbi:hypothetical protein C8N31_102429 [Sulfitobacter mediterraneus]|uniref:Uncharacterized protein n=1 Tax=Sulfitobacter mediterraneus TaxID=83219 RepID=A0A2T6CII7_9RHOB|nr:hypothetical protein C8N31_102429 [Sulfitobacter mediterraneus]